MRQVYIKHLTHVYAAAADAYIIDDPVPPGKILLAHRSAAWFTNIANSEFIWWFIRIAHENLWAGMDKPGATNGPAERDLQTEFGEGVRLGCYSPDITTGETFHFLITGCMYDLEHWRMLGMPHMQE